jgi:hypothetical protein
VPISVHPGRDQRMHIDHPPALADLEHQGVRGDEGVRALIERERNSPTWASSSAAITLTCDFDNRVMPRASTNFSIRRVDTPSR